MIKIIYIIVVILELVLVNDGIEETNDNVNGTYPFHYDFKQ